MHCKMFEPRLPFEGLRRLLNRGPNFLSSGRKPLECQCFHGMHRQDRAEDGGSSQKRDRLFCNEGKEGLRVLPPLLCYVLLLYYKP